MEEKLKGWKDEDCGICNNQYEGQGPVIGELDISLSAVRECQQVMSFFQQGYSGHSCSPRSNSAAQLIQHTGVCLIRCGCCRDGTNFLTPGLKLIKILDAF
jgi:hypothetical protein